MTQTRSQNRFLGESLIQQIETTVGFHTLNYLDKPNSLLHPISAAKPLALDLFTGCGGLALGFEMDADCCATCSHNLKGDCIKVKLDTDYVFLKRKWKLVAFLASPPAWVVIKTVSVMYPMGFRLSFLRWSKPSPTSGCSKTCAA